MRSLGLVLQVLLSAVLVVLPRPWIGRLEERFDLRSQGINFLSGLVQFAFFALFTAFGFRLYVKAQVEATDMMGVGTLWLNPLLPLIYLLTTLRGFFGALGTIGAAVRLIHLAVTGKGCADPTPIEATSWARVKAAYR